MALNDQQLAFVKRNELIAAPDPMPAAKITSDLSDEEKDDLKAQDSSCAICGRGGLGDAVNGFFNTQITTLPGKPWLCVNEIITLVRHGAIRTPATDEEDAVELLGDGSVAMGGMSFAWSGY